MKRYFKLIYISLLSALFLMAVSNLLNKIQIDHTLGLTLLVVLITIQITVYAKAEYELLLEIVQSLKIVFVYYFILITYKKEREDYVPSFFTENNRFLLQVIRC